MLKRFVNGYFHIFCVGIILSQWQNCAVFAKTKNASDLAKLNKQIEEKKKATALIEKQKQQLAVEIRTTQKKMVEIANNVKEYEKKLYDYDKQLSSLKARERELNKKIEQNNNDLIKIIAVFENISQVPQGYLIASPSKIDVVFNSSILLKTLVDELNYSKKRATDDLNELIALRDNINKAKLSIYTLNNKVKGEKDKISNLIKSKKSTQQKLNAEQIKTKKEMSKLIAESKTIEDFLKKAERLRKERESKRKKSADTSVPTSPKSKPTFRISSGTAPLPVSGVISTYFGEERASGVRSKGIYLKVLNSSQVISPTDAEVVFSGSFYGYKNLLILHSSTDNHYIIMGGLSSIFADEGQTLLAGEPVGETGSDDFYIEIRDRETPINPLQYFKL